MSQGKTTLDETKQCVAATDPAVGTEPWYYYHM